MNPPTLDSLCNIDQFSKNGICRRAARQNRPVKLRLTWWRLDPPSNATAPRTAAIFSCFSAMSYCGGLSSPPSQPRTLDSIGSFDAVEVWTRPHFWHSNVRRSQPEGPPSILERSIFGTRLSATRFATNPIRMSRENTGTAATGSGLRGRRATAATLTPRCAPSVTKDMGRQGPRSRTRWFYLRTDDLRTDFGCRAMISRPP